ncbi:hypothetical protein C2W62_08470 [Candidatus Entotheonella serta]|nr:hypothetical protein C2W62_08470 [Candidatus Entotheonella serta]
MRASRFFVQGQQLAANDQLDEALNAFEQALARRPHMAGVHLHYAFALSNANRLDEAVAAMQNAMAIGREIPCCPCFSVIFYSITRTIRVPGRGVSKPSR